MCRAGNQTCTSGQWGICTDQILPSAEVCDNKDNNCNGATDEELSSDADGDGHYTLWSCKKPDDDCDDGEKTTYPGAVELCDDKDNDCDGETDENCQCNATDTGSSTSLSTGNYHHSQDVFNNVTLIYDSRRANDGVLGRGWTHSYDIKIASDSDDSLELTEDGTAVNFRVSGDVYKAEPRSGISAEIKINSDNTYTLTKQNSTVYQFDNEGKLLSIKDRNNNQTVLSYTNDLLTSVTDPFGRTTVFTYNSSNQMTGITDPAGRETTLSYNSAGLLSSVTNPDGNGWSYTYDSSNMLISKTDPLGATSRATYDPSGRMIQATDAEGNIKTISYDHTSTTSTVTEWDGGVWSYKYDDSLNVQTEITDPNGSVRHKVYDEYKNLLSETDESGKTTTYTYDSVGNMLTSINPEGNTTTYTYNSFGQITSLTASDGRTTTYSYDANGNLLSVTDPSGAVSSYTYDSKGQALTATDAEGRVTSYIHDAYGNVSSVRLSDGSIYTFTYNISGNLLTQTDPAGSTTTYEYDIMGNLVTVTDPSGNSSFYTFDAKGNKTSSTDANGNTTHYEYDLKGRLIKVIDSLGNATIYTYGGAACPSCGGGTDKLTSITDAGGNTTTYEYDLLGKLTKETDPSGNTITYSYDESGNLISKTDSTGITITYTYDLLNRLTGIAYPDTSQTVTYTYETSGKVLTMTDQSGTATYTYDDSKRLIYETKSMDGISYATSYTYTAGGSLSSLTYPSGRTVTYNQNAFGKPASVTEAKDSATKDVIKNITYNANGTVSNITYGNGLVTAKGYDVKGALNSMNIGALKSLSYTRDNVGNITSITDNLDPAKTKTYAYDALYRLAQAVGPWGTIQYTYDPIGNRTVETAGAGVTNYAYAANKLLSSTGVKSFTFNYDNNGNTVAESRPLNAERSFTYNQNQRLIKAADDGKTLGEYVYNGNGQRVKKTVNGKKTYFFYDQSGNLIEEADGEGKPIADYIYLGGTPIGRVDMNKDNMPPITAISVGSPRYQTFISVSTAITLTATDEGNPPSGIDYSEYRLDDEALWTRYSNAFNLGTYSEGAHTLVYRSVDKAGNLEDAKTLTVILDKTVPVSSVNFGTPQYQADDVFYVGGITPINITAADAGSGIGKIEYAVDEGAYNIYVGAFTLSTYSDGQHIIRYRTTDNVLNVEAEKTLTVTLDKTPPVTMLSASDELYEGVANTVSPKTRFFLESTDDSVGIKEVLYKVDNGIWSTYLVGFPLPGVAGSHTIGYKAIDKLENEGAAETLTVNMIVIDVTKEISTEPVVLAGAWGSTPATKTAITNLTSILSSSGLSYHIPQTEEEFKASLRNGRYNTYLLVDFKTEGLVDELREAVNYGDGLVYIKTLPDTIPSLQEVFGVQFNGMSTEKDLTVSLVESEISEAMTLLTMGKAVKTTIIAATAGSLGTVTDKKETYAVIVTNPYGRGKVVLFTFDLLSSADQTKVKDLVVNSINYVMPAETYARAMSDVPIKINLQNSTEPVDVKVTETLPDNTSADLVSPSAITSDNTITWQFNVGASGRSPLSYWLTLPDMAGEYQPGTELKYSNQGDYRLYGNYSLTVTVFSNSTDLLADAIADLQGLAVSKSDEAHTNNAIGYLNQVRDYSGITKPDAQANIDNILNALKEFEKVSVDVSAIRLKLDELLKIWQAKWNLAPVAVSQVSRYKLAYEMDARKMEKQVADSSCPSFLRTVVGNPVSCKKPVLLASAGSTSQLLNTSTTNDVLYFYHTDHLGTSILMTDNVGNKVWEGEFMPFGEAYSISGTIKNDLRFPGQYYDEETGTHYNMRRTYNQNLGRYYEKDPIGFEGDMNLWVYVANNPVNYADPLGLSTTKFPGNGNVWPGHGDQDNVCSWPAGVFNTNSCTKRCCKAHDDCYKKFGCNWSSWSGPIVGLNGVCQRCNKEAVECINRNIGETDCICGGASGSW